MDNANQRTGLNAGQSLRMTADIGMTVLNLKGTVVIVSAADWTGDQFLRQRVLLEEGEQFHVDCAGWIEVIARTDAEVLAIAPAAIDSSLIARGIISMTKKSVQWLRSVRVLFVA